MFFFFFNIPRLTDEQMFLCEERITTKECTSVLKSFQCNKAPGNDGIPIEFYIKFWPIIRKSFLNCANKCFIKDETSCSQKQTVITLIERKGKDQ